MALADVHMLWIGDRVSPLEQTCMQSFCIQGHRVFLHLYNEILGIPSDVTLVDANKLIDRKEIFRHKNGSLAIFADFFRYEILKNYPEVYWADADIYCIRPFDFDREYVIAGHDAGDYGLYTNNAVLKIPHDSELLRHLAALRKEPEKSLKFLPLSKAKKIRFLSAFGWNKPVEQYPFGISGPLGLRAYVRQLDLEHHLLRTNPFERVSGDNLFKPNFDFELLEDQTIYAMHFYQSVKNKGQTENPISGSFYDWCLRQTGHHPELL